MGCLRVEGLDGRAQNQGFLASPRFFSFTTVLPVDKLLPIFFTEEEEKSFY
jgi:hypothetical protein